MDQQPLTIEPQRGSILSLSGARVHYLALAPEGGEGGDPSHRDGEGEGPVGS